MNVFFQKTHQRAFGTFPLSGKEFSDAFKIATDVGYRAIDTAQMYGNEEDVGNAIKSSGIASEEFMITTKVHPNNFDANQFIPSVEQSLKLLQVDSVDVLLLHWPPADGNIKPSLELLNKAQELGLAKNIGVSNYNAKMMRDAIQITNHPLVTNQVEFHPLLNQATLLNVSAETGIPLSSYCSVARGEVFKHPLFAELGEQYGKTAGQIVLRWILQKGVSINTMSTKQENIKNNFDVMDFTLSTPDLAKIDAMTNTNYRIVTKNIVPWAPEWD